MSNNTCYTIGMNFVTASNQYFTCGDNTTVGGVQSCCYAGDYCMSNGICHYTHPVTNGTGYYMSGCTDLSWDDDACPKQCTSQYGADVIYDTTNDDWNCCTVTENSKDCQHPSNHTVDAPAPSDLVILKHLTQSLPSISTSAVGPISTVPTGTATFSGSGMSTSTSTSSTSAAAAAATSSDAPSSMNENSSNGLTGGAKAGIAVGVIAGAAILFALILFCFMRRRKTPKDVNEMDQEAWKPGRLGGSSSEGSPGPHEFVPMKDDPSSSPSELPMSIHDPRFTQPAFVIPPQEKAPDYNEFPAREPVAHEMEGQNGVHELPVGGLPRPANSFRH